MNDLIKINAGTIDGQVLDTVNARDLHAFLEVGKDFTTWIKDRIKQYGFASDHDFMTISRSPISGSGNRGASIDYHLTIDMAKELSMVERNEKGKQARQYFIECERRAKAQPATHQLPKTLSEALLLAGRIEAEKERLSLELKAAAPKIEFFDAVERSESTMTLNQAAKVLGTGEKTLRTSLKECGVFQKNGTPYQKHIDCNHFELSVRNFTNNYGYPQTYCVTLVTGKWLQWLQKKFAKPDQTNQMKITFNPNPFGEYKEGCSTDVLLKLLHDYRRPMDVTEIKEKTGITKGQCDWAIRILERDAKVKVSVATIKDGAHRNNGRYTRKFYEAI